MNPLRAYRQWRESLRVFAYYLRKYRRYYAIGITALVVVDTLEAVPPLLLKRAVDGLAGLAHGEALRALLLQVVLLYVAVAFLQGGMRYLWRNYIVRTSMRASHDMREELFGHLCALSPSFFQKRRVGELVSLSTNDIEALRFALGPGALTLFDALFYFLVIPPIMLWISPKLTLLAFGPLIVVPFFVRRMEAQIKARFEKVQECFSSMAAQCQEALAGVRVVKGSALEPLKEREQEALGAEYIEANLDSARAQAALTAGLEAILGLSTTVLFLVGGAFVIRERISIGVFVAFQRYIQKLQWPMEAFGLAANIFQRSAASQGRIDEVLAEKPALASPARPRALAKGVPALEVRGLSFTYPGAARPSLRDVSFTVPPGKRVGIAGGIGSGKSTLLACLARMQPVPTGTVLYGGIDANELSLHELRRRIAFVPQESFLFSRTVERNVLYGSEAYLSADSTLRRRAAEEAAGLASVAGEIACFPAGYGTLLGERGMNISGGQRQRLTIARALARAPELLYLDDCLSAVDAETEARLLRGLTQASEGITLLLASHRLASFRALDWLILLDDGRINAQGDARTLLRDHPAFASLAREEKLREMDLLR